MSACNICTNKVTTKSPGLQCGGKCEKFFHAKCTGIQVKDLQSMSIEGVIWKCPSCRSITRQNPNKSIIIADMENTTSSDHNQGTLQTLQQQITIMSMQLNEMSGKNYELLSSVKFCSDKVTEFEEFVKQMAGKLKIIDVLQHENRTLKTEIDKNNERINDLEQRTRIDNLEIQGVTDTKNEDIYKIIEK